MKKDYLLFTIIVLLFFIAGILIGKQFNQVGRYSFVENSKSIVILDSKTATFYVKDGNKETYTLNLKEDFENKKEVKKK